MMNMTKAKHLRLAVLASGRGSNFLAIQKAIDEGKLDAEICILLSDKEDAPALDKAKQLGIPAVSVLPRSFYNKEAYEKEVVHQLASYDIDIVVLAGYMRLLSHVLLEAYKMRVVNIHPALLPSFTGLHAQRQALEYGVKYSGCTVHFIDEGMDTGPIILQAVVPVLDEDTEDTLTDRILAEEHRIYKEALQLIASGCMKVDGRRVMIVNDEQGVK